MLSLISAGGGLAKFLSDLTFFSFWVNGDAGSWYIAAILLLYIITPWILKIEKRIPKIYILIIFVSVAIGVTIRLTPLTNVLGHLLIFVCRIPAYTTGLILGKHFKAGEDIKICKLALLLPVVSLIICLICLGYTDFYLPWAFKYYAYTPIAMLLVWLCSLLNTKLVNSVLCYFGSLSLEIFLLHNKVLWVLTFIRDKGYIVYGDWNNVVINVIAVLISCLGAKALSSICFHINHRLTGE